jgi:hypothetical protein
VEGGVEAGDLRAVRPARQRRSDASEVGALVQGRHGGELVQSRFDLRHKQRGCHEVCPAMNHAVADGDGCDRGHGEEERVDGLAVIGGARWFNGCHLASAGDEKVRLWSPNAAQMRTPYDIGRKTRNAHAR